MWGIGSYPAIICEICEARGGRSKVALTNFGYYRDGYVVSPEERQGVRERAWKHHFTTEHTGWRNTIRESSRTRDARLSGKTYKGRV